MTTTAAKWSALQADTGWEIRSPRGTLTHTTRNPQTARQVARAMAGIDALLKRAQWAITVEAAPANRPECLDAVGGAHR